VINLRLGPLSRILAPGFGWCRCCKTPWKFVEGHSTQYTRNSGCFPLCKWCWRDLSPHQRLPYYREMWEDWNRTGPDDSRWEDIERAVLEGL
jgi:hypothetical protein